MAGDTKILLTEAEIPTHWVNLMPDLPGEPAPPLRPDLQPAGPDDLSPIFPMGLIAAGGLGASPRSRSPTRCARSTSCGARRRCTGRAASSASSIPRRTSTTSTRAPRRPGSHKPNTAVPQAYYNREEGVRKLSTETGAGQWGSALAFACRLMDMECEVFMVGSSYDQKPYRRSMMETWGATVHRSPSNRDRRPGARRPRIRPARSASRSPRRSRSRPATRGPTTRSGRC